MHNLFINSAGVRTLPHLLSVLRLYTLMTRHSDDAPLDDISVKQVHRLLQELIEMTGQNSSGPQVLELQLGDYLTRTAVERRGSNHFLSISAALPKSAQPQVQSLSLLTQAGNAQLAEVDFLWHADEGRYVVVRNIPVRQFSDDRSVMDAILETADLAGKYQAALLSGDDLPTSN